MSAALTDPDFGATESWFCECRRHEALQPRGVGDPHNREDGFNNACQYCAGPSRNRNSFSVRFRRVRG